MNDMSDKSVELIEGDLPIGFTSYEFVNPNDLDSIERRIYELNNQIEDCIHFKDLEDLPYLKEYRDNLIHMNPFDLFTIVQHLNKDEIDDFDFYTNRNSDDFDSFIKCERFGFFIFIPNSES